MSLLGFQSDSAQHQKLLTGHFGGSAPGNYVSKIFWGEIYSYRDAESNRILAIAMRNQGIVLAVYYSPAFIGSLAGFVHCLQGVQLLMGIWGT